MAWDLRFTDESQPLVMLSRILMRGPIPRIKHVSPMPDAAFSGRFTIDGEERSAGEWRKYLGVVVTSPEKARYGQPGFGGQPRVIGTPKHSTP